YKVCKEAGIRVAAQIRYSTKKASEDFLKLHKRIVVKPLIGEQGQGVSVDIQTKRDLGKAIKRAAQFSRDVLLEEYIEGKDLRIIVIDNEIVAASIRKPATILGTGKHTIKQLVVKQNRRSMAATGGE